MLPSNLAALYQFRHRRDAIISWLSLWDVTDHHLHKMSLPCIGTIIIINWCQITFDFNCLIFVKVTSTNLPKTKLILKISSCSSFQGSKNTKLCLGVWSRKGISDLFQEFMVINSEGCLKFSQEHWGPFQNERSIDLLNSEFINKGRSQIKNAFECVWKSTARGAFAEGQGEFSDY